MTVNDALESVILVDRDDRPLGTAPKLATAISVLIHDGEGRLLVDRAEVGGGFTEHEFMHLFVGSGAVTSSPISGTRPTAGDRSNRRSKTAGTAMKYLTDTMGFDELKPSAGSPSSKAMIWLNRFGNARVRRSAQ